MTNPGIAIIGYGRFGRLIARFIASHSSVVVCDRKRITRPGYNVRAVALEEAVRHPVIILAVPIGSLQPLLRRIRMMVNPHALVVDVCSVKEEPMRWMRRSLPPTVEIVGTHPLFGPSSASRSVRGNTVVICPGRVRPATLARVRRHLRRAGLNIRVMSPSSHDRWIARTLFVTQFIGRGVHALIAQEDLPTEAFRLLKRSAVIAMNDSPKLVKDIYLYNRHTSSIPHLFRRNLISVLRNWRNR